eukprot:m.155586 g.155586  ORF g.155586 m.155586 type:complete len:360 (+) comp16422_c0_seq2:115-1194(+)
MPRPSWTTLTAIASTGVIAVASLDRQNPAPDRGHHRYLVVLGGGYGSARDQSSAQVFALPLPTNRNAWKHQQWQQWPNMVHPRRGAVALATSRHLLMVGGYDGTIHRSDIDSLALFPEPAWTLLEGAGLPVGLSCAVGGKLALQQVRPDTETFVLAGGYDGHECLDSVHALLVSKEGRVTIRPNMARLSEPRKNAAILPDSRGQSCLVLGGWDGQRTLASVERADALGVGPAKRMQKPRECHAAVNGVVVGGYNAVDCLMKDVESVGQDTVLIPELSSARECHACVAVDDALICVGGWDGFMALDNVVIWMPGEQEWHALPALPVGLNRPCAIVVEVHCSVSDDRNMLDCKSDLERHSS